MLPATPLFHNWYLFVFFRYTYFKCFVNRYAIMHNYAIITIKYIYFNIYTAKSIHFYLFISLLSQQVNNCKKNIFNFLV